MVTSTLTVTNTDPKSFIHLSQRELDDMFTGANTGAIPVGGTDGTAIFMPGTFVATIAWAIVRAFVWRGKVFSPATTDLLNKLTPFSILGIRANVYVGESWLGGQNLDLLATLLDRLDQSRGESASTDGSDDEIQVEIEGEQLLR